MSLRLQIAGLLVALSGVLVCVTYAVQAWVVMPAFAELERQGAVRDVARAVDAIERDLEALSDSASDWAAWDDTYQYIVDHNRAFEVSNMQDESFAINNVNLMCFIDNQDAIVWKGAREIETLEEIHVPDLFEKLKAADSPFLHHRDLDDARKAIVITPKGPILLAAQPILTSVRQGPIRGTMIKGRFLNRKEIDSLASRTHMQLKLWAVNDPSLPSDARPWIARCTQTGKAQVEVIDEATLHTYAIVNDAYAKPGVLLRIRLARDITAQGQVSAKSATMCTIAGGLLTLAVLGAVLQWRIIGPLRAMSAHAERVGNEDNLRARLNFSRRDEMGVLAHEFDSMVAHLSESRKKVLDSAHRSGMAEIASEVLHNVGNAVNSANCSVEMIQQRLERSKLAGLEKASSLLREQAPRAAEFFASDPRGPKLIDYLVNLTDILKQEQADIESETERLQGTVRHIRDAIATQQNFAGRSNFRQEVDLAKLVDEILQMNQEILRTAEIRVSVELPPLPELQLNKSKLTQVLVNLVRNAAQAMQAKPSDARHLTIAARLVDEDGLEIDVCDTGIGFGDDVREKLFTHGFTTKAEGNGFGLHYCANAIRESGGSVTAQSPGPGQGATFRIRLPQVLPGAVSVS